MRLGDLLTHLKTYSVGDCKPFYDMFADVMDVLQELSETKPSVTAHSFGAAGGLLFNAVHVDFVIKLGLQQMIEAHRHVEATRVPIRAARYEAEVARTEWERSG